MNSEANNPYLDARREWNERFGSYIAQAATWRFIAVLAMLVAAVAVGGAIYLASQTRFIPYIVEVDQLGRAHAKGTATKASKLDVRIVQAAISDIHENWRNVTMDVEVQKKRVFKLYAHLSTASAAFTTMNTHFQRNDPFKRAVSELVNIEVTSVLKIGEDNWQTEWTETTNNRKGKVINQQYFQSAMKVTYTRETDDQKEINKNPTGIYIADIAWSEILNTKGEK